MHTDEHQRIGHVSCALTFAKNLTDCTPGSFPHALDSTVPETETLTLKEVSDVSLTKMGVRRAMQITDTPSAR